jgi:putative ubiquitin-RnfH superfamily antitoxin RatB of RatAB toxin-antitoxin module
LATACKVEFQLHYEFSSKLLEKALGPVFHHIANTFVDSFVRRAGQVLSRQWLTPFSSKWSTHCRKGRTWCSLRLPAGGTVQQAIEASALPQKYPEIDLKKNKVGVFGKLVRLDAPLRDRDRVEIYRPLIADPKEVRKKRADEGKAMKKALERKLRGLEQIYLHQD